MLSLNNLNVGIPSLGGLVKAQLSSEVCGVLMLAGRNALTLSAVTNYGRSNIIG
jgi:hypothetical protein